jgi:hypothetical protein
MPDIDPFSVNRRRFLGAATGSMAAITGAADESAAAVDIQGTTGGLRFKDNELRETRGQAKRVGFRLGKDAKDVRLEGNKVEGFATEVDDQRKR